MKQLSVIVLLLIVLIVSTGCEMFFTDPEVLAAVKTGDPVECKKLIDDDDSRANQCLRKMAEQEGDVEICDMMTENKGLEYCYWDVAKATGDETVCENVIDKDACYAQAASFDNDVKVCDNIMEESARARCIRYTAAAKGEKEHCDQFSGEEYNKCIHVFASENGGSHCNDEKLPAEEVADCVSIYANKISECRIIEGQIEFKNDFEACLSRAAVKEGKATTCMELSEHRQKDCVKQVAREHDEPNACERLSGAALDECFYEYGSYESEPKVCKKISDAALKAKCQEEAE